VGDTAERFENTLLGVLGPQDWRELFAVAWLEMVGGKEAQEAFNG
jgi:hypothetical protein